MQMQLKAVQKCALEIAPKFKWNWYAQYPSNGIYMPENLYSKSSTMPHNPKVNGSNPVTSANAEREILCNLLESIFIKLYRFNIKFKTIVWSYLMPYKIC
jgi:hypothetical protein